MERVAPPMVIRPDEEANRAQRRQEKRMSFADRLKAIRLMLEQLALWSAKRNDKIILLHIAKYADWYVGKNKANVKEIYKELKTYYEGVRSDYIAAGYEEGSF